MQRAVRTMTSGLLVVSLAALVLAASASASEVLFWTWTTGAGYDAENKIIDMFRAQRPDITVTYDVSNVRNGESLVVAIAGGVPPDLTATHQDWHRDFAYQGLFLDLRPYIERDGFDLSVFPRELMEYYTGPNGEITGFPSQFTTIVLGYNKDLFERYALPYPQVEWTLDDMVAAAQKFTIDENGDGEADQWGLHIGPLHEYVWRLWGLTLMAEDGRRSNLDDPRAIESFRWLASLYLDYGVVGDAGGNRESPRWTSGKIGMALAWPHYLTLWGTALQSPWDIEQIPTGPSGRKVARGATAGWGIPASAKNPDGAWEVLKFLASMEAQLALLQSGRGGTTLPAVREYYSRVASGADVGFAAPGSMANVSAIVAGYEYASIDRYPPGFAAIWRDVINPGIQQIVRGQAPPETVMPEVDRQVEAIVAANQ